MIVGAVFFFCSSVPCFLYRVKFRGWFVRILPCTPYLCGLLLERRQSFKLAREAPWLRDRLPYRYSLPPVMPGQVSSVLEHRGKCVEFLSGLRNFEVYVVQWRAACLLFRTCWIPGRSLLLVVVVLKCRSLRHR